MSYEDYEDVIRNQAASVVISQFDFETLGQFLFSQFSGRPNYLYLGVATGAAHSVIAVVPGREFSVVHYLSRHSRVFLTEKKPDIISQIRSIASDPEMLDEGETLPGEAVVNKAIALIQGASRLGEIPEAKISIFFGELNVTWRSGDRIVRLACFSHSPTLLQTGFLSRPVGNYNSEQNPTSEQLAEKLGSLVRENELEILPSLG